MNDFSSMPLQTLIRPEGFSCTCGKHHGVDCKFIKIGRDAVTALPEAIKAVGAGHPFIVCDMNTKRAAWDKVKAVLDAANIPYQLHVFHNEHIEPDEHAMGELTLAIEPKCDCVLAIGSGVINDCCRILAKACRLPQLVVGTAPSMDGYASNSSSMIVNRCKTTVLAACPQAIIADTMIMKDAPERMLWAGLGDMLAKYIAQCEWRVTALVNGEYYCEDIAALMRASLKKIVNAAPRLMERDPEVIGAVVEGLILSGFAMAFAQVSRPASGIEHYFSHLWEMFALDRNLPLELHGIQVGVGTYLALNVYDEIRKLRPTKEQAEEAFRHFSPDAWEQNIRRVFGQAAQTLIDTEYAVWHKNDPDARRVRMEKLVDNWDTVLRIIDEELPATQDIIALMETVGMPIHPSEIGQSETDVRDAFQCGRDTRDKYLTSSMLWDLGLLDGFPLTM